MRTRDLTDLRPKVESLLHEASRQQFFPRSPEEYAANLLEQRDFLDDLADAIEDLAEGLDGKLDELKADRKRCANEACQRWILQSGSGRPREFCDEGCRSAARRARRAA